MDSGLSVNVASDTDPVGITVTLTEVTSGATTFTGSFGVDPSSSNTSAGTLAAAGDDTITVEYTDTNTPFGTVIITDVLTVVSASQGTIAFKNSTSSSASDVTEASIGSQVAVHVHDIDLAAVVTITATVTSDTDAVGIAVTLYEVTANTTTFTGLFTVSTSTSSTAGTLASNIGDTVTATYNDANPAGTVVDTLTVVSLTNADLAVSKADSPDPVDVGQQLTYVFTVTNSGPDEAVGVILTDVMTTSTSFGTATTTQGSCGESLGTVTCNFGTMGASATLSVTVVVIPSKAGLLSNDADVSSDTFDPVTTNNSATTITTVLDPSLVDTQGPQISNISPPDGTIASSVSAYSADIVDSDSGVDIATAVFLVNTNSDNVAGATQINPFFISFAFIDDAAGNVIGIKLTMSGISFGGPVWVTVRASDVAGNETTFDVDAVTPGIQMARIVIDYTAPTLASAFTGVWYDPVNKVLMFNDRKKILVTFADNLTNLDPASISTSDFTVQDNVVVAADWYDADLATSTVSGLEFVDIRRSVFLTLQSEVGFDETPLVALVGDRVDDEAGNTAFTASTTALDRISINIALFPGLTGWALAALAAVFGVLLIWRLRRSRTAATR